MSSFKKRPREGFKGAWHKLRYLKEKSGLSFTISFLHQKVRLDQTAVCPLSGLHQVLHLCRCQMWSFLLEKKGSRVPILPLLAGPNHPLHLKIKSIFIICLALGSPNQGYEKNCSSITQHVLIKVMVRFHISRKKLCSLAVFKLYLTSMIHPQPRPLTPLTSQQTKTHPLITAQSHLSSYSHYLDIITFQKLSVQQQQRSIRIDMLAPIILKFGS